MRNRLSAILILSVLGGACEAYDVWIDEPYLWRYPYYGGIYDDVELARLRDELRAQRLFDRDAQQRQQQGLELLRQQAFSERRINARQACYDRTTGGFEVCADLFAPDTPEFDDCEALVLRRNPSCNEVPLKRRNEPTENAP